MVTKARSVHASSIYDVKQGDIWVVNFEHSATGDSKYRRSVVISSDSYNGNPHCQSVLVVPLSSLAGRAPRADEVIIEPDALAGINRVVTTKTSNIQPVQRWQLLERKGCLTVDVVDQILRCLDIRLGRV